MDKDRTLNVNFIWDAKSYVPCKDPRRHSSHLTTPSNQVWQWSNFTDSKISHRKDERPASSWYPSKHLHGCKCNPEMLMSFYFSKCSHAWYWNLKERLKACHLHRQFKKYPSQIQLKYIEFFSKGPVISFLHSNNLPMALFLTLSLLRLLDSGLYCWEIKEGRQATVAPDGWWNWSSWLVPSRLPVQETSERTQRQADGTHILYILLSRLGPTKQQEPSHRTTAHLTRSYSSVSFSQQSCSYTDQLEDEGEDMERKITHYSIQVNNGIRRDVSH